MRRAQAVVAAALLAAAGVSAPAAAVTTGCDPSSRRYVPDEGCEIRVDDLDQACEGGIPQLTYDLTVRGVRAGRVDIQWLDASGETRLTYAGARLSGTVSWPGAVVSPAGTATDWPGWTERSDGSWVEGDAFDWATGAVDVVFSVASGPSVTVDATYPDDEDCGPAAAVPVSTRGTTAGSGGGAADGASDAGGLSRVLAATGLEASTLALGAGGLLVGGTTLVLARRGRRGGAGG